MIAELATRFPLPWPHYVRLLSVDNPQARAFYEAEALRGGWSVPDVLAAYRKFDAWIATGAKSSAQPTFTEAAAS